MTVTPAQLDASAAIPDTLATEVLLAVGVNPADVTSFTLECQPGSTVLTLTRVMYLTGGGGRPFTRRYEIVESAR